MRSVYTTLLVALLLACAGEPAKDESKPEKDLESFVLPEEVRTSAPHMQAHLYRLLPYVSPRFQIKPRFVYAEGEAPTIDSLMVGPLEPTVMHMGMIHLAYYRNDVLQWSGSVLAGLNQGFATTTADGLQVRIVPKPDLWEVSFNSGQQSYDATLPKEEDETRWLRGNGEAIYLYHYHFPAEFFKQK